MENYSSLRKIIELASQSSSPAIRISVSVGISLRFVLICLLIFFFFESIRESLARKTERNARTYNVKPIRCMLSFRLKTNQREVWHMLPRSGFSPLGISTTAMTFWNFKSPFKVPIS